MSRRAVGAGVGKDGAGAGDGGKAGDGGQSKQAQLLADDAGHFSMIRAMHLADLITTGNGFCGIMSIFSSMRYCLSPDPTDLTNLWAALAFMPFGLFFDFFDGKVARWRGKSSLMGQELDSLADLISFGAAPAALAFALGIRTPLDHVCLAFFVICGLLRLARFNVTVAALPKDASGKSKYFEGTPIPTSLFIAALMAVWVWKGWVGEGLDLQMERLRETGLGGVMGTVMGRGDVLKGLPGGTWGQGWFAVHPVVGLFVVHGCLMVSKTVRIPKP